MSAEAIKTQNKNLISLLNTNPITVSELANEILLKIAFFDVSAIVSVCVKFQYFDIRNSVLETEYTPGLVLTNGVQF